MTAPPTEDLVTIRRTGEAPAVWAMGSLFEQLVADDRTAGAFGAAVVTQPPGLATPTHVHTRESEAWFVLDGRVSYLAGDERVELGAGDFIYLPRGVPHAFRITGTTPARYLALSLPGRLMTLYDEIGTPAGHRQLPDGGIPPDDVRRWLELAPSYGLQVVGPPIPDLTPQSEAPRP